jgi:hypothetical protein
LTLDCNAINKRQKNQQDSEVQTTMND